ncbi:MAG TPA: M28 family peptidase [Candidatus Thermoplasmatota archaeon]
MRILVVALFAALTLAAFAGCLDPEAETDPGNEAPAPTGEWVMPAIPKVDAAKMLEAHEQFVSTFSYRANNHDMHIGARDYLETEFDGMGLPVWRQKFTPNNGLAQENICGVKLGEVEPATWVVVGGHYDTTTTDESVGVVPPGQGLSSTSQGAYDDGSGTWITVELAREYAKIPTYYSVLFCGFDGEERGLQGSRAVFDSMHGIDDRHSQLDPFPYANDRTRGMIDFDMFGICWPVRAPIYFDQNDEVLLSEVDAIRKGMEIPDDMFKATGITLGQSDYAHWYGYQEEHIPTAFFISDFEELGAPTPVEQGVTPSAPGAYPWWHQQDTVETMRFMAGGQEMLEAGFQTALDLGTQTLALMVLMPEVEFESSTSA